MKSTPTGGGQLRRTWPRQPPTTCERGDHFIGEAGTYELTGSTMTMRPLVANNLPTMAPGAFVTYSYKLAGDTLWVTFQKNQNGPIVNPVTVKAVRVE